MKTKILSALAALAAILTVIGSLDLSGFITLLPDKVAAGFGILLPALAAVVHAVKAIGDAADDGKINGSFGHYRCHPVALFGAAVVAILALACSSCSTDSTWHVRTPYGDANGEGGTIIISPKPIIIPSK